MRSAIGFLIDSLVVGGFGGFLLAVALVFNAPLLIAVRLARKRLRPLVPKLALALGFALATSYRLWEMEWFDVWRHGVPSLGYLLRGYAPWIIALGSAGWLVGGLVTREPGRQVSCQATRNASGDRGVQ